MLPSVFDKLPMDDRRLDARLSFGFFISRSGGTRLEPLAARSGMGVDPDFLFFFEGDDAIFAPAP